MKYLKLYEQFRIFEAEQEDLISKYGTGGDRGQFSGMPDPRSESGQIAKQSYKKRPLSLNKKLILFSGPSASGKTYLAENILKAKSWIEDESVSMNSILVGTDSIQNEKANPMFSKLLLKAGFPVMSKIAAEFKDQWFTFEEYKDEYNKWEKAASEEEKKKYAEIRPYVGYNLNGGSQCPDCLTKVRGGVQDGRVSGMAWVAVLHPAKTIIFDDIDVTINNFFTGITDYLLYTPFDWYLKNIQERNAPGGDPTMRIDLENKEAGIYQYMKWFKASDSPALDNRKFTKEEATKMLEETGYTNADEIFSMLGVKGDSFYIASREVTNPDEIINTRENSTGKAKDISSLKV